MSEAMRRAEMTNPARLAAVAKERLQHAHRQARIGFIGVGWWATSNHMPALAAPF
jgi:hypothetical protein